MPLKIILLIGSGRVLTCLGTYFLKGIIDEHVGGTGTNPAIVISGRTVA